MAGEDPPLRRVIDLIAHLQNHDPVAPVQVWTLLPEVHSRVRAVIQITPSYLQEHGISGDPRDRGEGPYPVAILVE